MNQSSNHEPSVPTIGRRFKSKPVMIIAVVVAIAAVLIFVLSSGSDGEKQASEAIRKFQNAVAAEDTRALSKLLSVDDA